MFGIPALAMVLAFYCLMPLLRKSMPLLTAYMVAMALPSGYAPAR